MEQQTRRGALAMFATAPVAALPGLAVLTGSESAQAAGMSSNMRALFDRYHAIDRALDDWLETVSNPAREAIKAEIEAVPHHRTVNRFVNVTGDRTSLGTDDPSTVAIARRVKADGLAAKSDDYQATIDELLSAADAREERIAAIRKAHRTDDLDKEESERGEALCAAIDAIYEAEAHSVADLAAKLDLVAETDNWLHIGFQEALVADVRRLVGMEALHA